MRFIVVMFEEGNWGFSHDWGSSSVARTTRKIDVIRWKIC
jgi:hypothetical protein